MASPDTAVAAALELRSAGVLVGCFRPPSVPDGVSRLRVTARADLAPDEVDEATRLIRAVVARRAGARA
jgi:8-amino-7-oxononanoate synthase